MKNFFLVSIFGFITLITSQPEDKYRKHFESFKLQYPQSYDLREEERLQNFKKNFDFIELMNELHEGDVKFEINKFADRDTEIHLRKLNGARTPTKLNSSSPYASKYVSSIDWRTENIVTSVKDQGYCGCCWAFSSCAALESALIKYKNKRFNLSEQNLVDCVSNNLGCDGGDIDNAYDYIRNGIMDNSSYPYIAKNDTCKFSSSDSVAKVKGSLYFNNETALENALISFGPIVTLVQVTNEFYFYKSGVMKGLLCTSGVNHAVTVVGFNNTANPPYWIVKNSWGPSWGEDGYFRIRKGNSTCQIGFYNYHPIM